MDFPGVVQGMVLIAPSLGPGLERTFWVTPLLVKKFLKKLVPSGYKSASLEKLAHKRELSKMLPLWKRIDIPVFYLQSKKDPIVYVSNADFAKKNLTQVPLLK